MPSIAHKKTVILVAVIVISFLLILRHSPSPDFHKIADSVKGTLHFVPQKKTFQTWPENNPIPETTALQTMNLNEISNLYFNYVNTLQVFCPVKKVYGGVKYGWYTCDVVREDNPKSCVAYMITNRDVTKNFFEELKQDYQCEKNVILKRSPTLEDNSQIETLKSKKVVDYMAIDIREEETLLLSWMLTKDLLKNVRQLLVNFHGIKFDSTVSVYVEHLQVLRALYTEGFRTFHFARNIRCLFAGNWRRTGCYSLYMMREISVSGPIEVFTPETINSKPLVDLATQYNSLLMSSQVHCKEVVRIGDVDDGGWDVCNDLEYRPSKPCLVYSFGVAGDWTFDDEVSRIYGCEVHSFDPSIGKKDHKRSDKITFHNIGLWGKPKGKQGTWNMMNLKEIIEMLEHTGKIIDIMKMDIESSEWSAIPDMLTTGVLKNVRQLDFEFHGTPNPHDLLRSKMKTLRGIYDQGFRLFWSHPNIKGGNPTPFTVTGRQVSSCYENYYLNTNLSKT
ncbi:uncharacterized protein LOC110455479 [Mizuhopecten yessoensis]|uniref:Methyltransferase-like protein 24 n=1 Tax=Mizuhopecten yessoensis TaxID=6573 RepID=A0A210QCZ0_MIZYE|nr:uncharacterized protein LOC110455479 [Mizuhopecten yessoensis]XP_021361315.1 uncharacterized protein LOC110455479 [Mizuhopecten yessoensis]XP_021361316.1 uncharacterized protein LOC110455479 [Mizuhopecten yessoensis]OWF46623.1 Methyltransferase-like protein 24 [Mizuhopecten yessoensis]